MLTEAYWVRYTRWILREMEAQKLQEDLRRLKFRHWLEKRKRRHYVMQGRAK